MADPEPVRLGFTKWDGAAHWQADVMRLGEDEHGVWLGAPAGCVFTRPGMTTVTRVALTCLLPRDQPFAATFYDEPGAGARRDMLVYVDVTTVPLWRDGTLELVDLDLDVIRLRDGSVLLDDEDEFEQHRVELGYPEALVALARASAADLLRQVAAYEEPFGTASERWLAHVRR